MVHRISLGIQKTEPLSMDPQLPSVMSSQSQPMGSSSTGPPPAVTMSSQVMVAAVIFLFAVVAFVVFLFLYAKHFWGPGRALRRSLSRARFVFADDPAHPLRRGLDAAVLRALPVTIFQSVDFKEGGLECSVCLTELSDGEEARLLPKCNHGFHRDCIDMWLHSHSTCPLCRCPVAVGPVPSAHPDTMEALPREAISISTESLLLPTNVFFWGTQDLVSTRELVAQQEPAPSSSSSTSSLVKPEGMLAIEIPRRVVEGFGSPLPTSRFPGEEMKTPPSARLRSLRRLLSRGKRTVGSSCSPSPRGADIEQGGGRASLGEGSSLAPRTPTTS